MKSTLALCALLLMTGGVEVSAQNAQELMRRGDAHDRKFEAGEALKSYLPAEKLQPDNAALLVKIARQYIYLMDDHDGKADKVASARKGLAYAERAVKAAPDDSDAHLAMAICTGKLLNYLGNREAVEASRSIKESAEKAVQLNPRSDYAWHMLGRWHQGMVELGPVKRNLARLIYGSMPDASYDKAVECFQKAASLNPRRLIHPIELGRTYALMGKTNESTVEINKGLAMPSTEHDDEESKQRGRDTLKSLKK